MVSRIGVALVFLILSASTGCGSTIYPVTGKLVWADGKPATELADGQVVFESTSEESSAIGVVQADGSFRLTTLTENDGALLGEHKVMVLEVRGAVSPGSNVLAPGKLDERFADASRSPLTAKVEPKDNEITLTVERRK